MPELPEVETVRRGLAPVMEGAVITRLDQRRADLRFPFPSRFEARLTGRRIVSLGRRAKYLLADLDDGTVLVMHLGMSGSFRIFHEPEGRFHHARSRDPRHDHVVFHLSDGVEVVYNDPRRFGFMDLVPRADLSRCKHFKDMGLEPTGNALSGKVLANLFRGKHTPLKAALLDQHLIAGLGNIYVCEVLWRAQLSPEREAGTLAGRGMAKRAERLAVAIRDVLEAAIAAGGSSLRDHRQTDGELGYFQHTFKVYDREGAPCPRAGCTGTITRMVQSGRSTFHCPTCQS